jgi:hypothetical protein
MRRNPSLPEDNLARGGKSRSIWIPATILEIVSAPSIARGIHWRISCGRCWILHPFGDFGVILRILGGHGPCRLVDLASSLPSAAKGIHRPGPSCQAKDSH